MFLFITFLYTKYKDACSDICVFIMCQNFDISSFGNMRLEIEYFTGQEVDLHKYVKSTWKMYEIWVLIGTFNII